MQADKKAFLTSLFDAAVAAADPERSLLQFLPEKPKGKTVLIGAGKGAAQLARAFEQNWNGPLEGVVVTRYDYAVPCQRIEVLEASHPLPDASGIEAAARLFQAVSNLSKDDLVVALICGGGSALLPAPPQGFALEDEIALNRALLASGAPISVMNNIRKHFSLIKGGRLALAAAPAKVVTLVVSDVPGDAPAQVASGPTIADPSTRTQALAAIERYALKLSDKVMRYFSSEDASAPTPEDPHLQGNEVHVIASAGRSLEAAARVCEQHGIPAVILSDALEGEAREAGKFHAAIAKEVVSRSRPFRRPVVLLSGGETTVTLRGSGRGGRNSEFLLSFAMAIDGTTDIYAIAADTDGIDGSEDNAGALADGATISEIRRAGKDAAALLADNDAWTAFSLSGGLFVPGPTGTNVNDFRAILIE